MLLNAIGTVLACLFIFLGCRWRWESSVWENSGYFKLFT